MTVDPDFVVLRQRHSADLVALLETIAGNGGPFQITPRQLAATSTEPEAAALRLLRDPALEDWLREEERFTCPAGGEELSAEEAAEEVCPYHPDVAFADHGGVGYQRVFIHEAPRTRDVPWALALHGMNTRGPWQENFNWLFSRSYGGGQMVPVAIYKYGVIRPGVLARWRQRQLVRDLVARIRRLSGEAAGSGFGGRPDVIAHSFGTWLLGHALTSQANLRVGRVILLGSILRPDFDWRRLVDRGQVEAVLNHHGTADRWVRIAQRFIPCSGPSGRRGFNQPIVHNVPAADFAHSQFFRADVMPFLFASLWQQFLTWPSERLDRLPGRTSPSEFWRSSPWRWIPRRERCSFSPPAACH